MELLVLSKFSVYCYFDEMMIHFISYNMVENKLYRISEVDDPEVIFRKAEALSKKEEKSASQKKADKNAAARKKKEITSAAVITTVAREAEAKKPQLPVGGGMKKNDCKRKS